jgi:hypothetical protein
MKTRFFVRFSSLAVFLWLGSASFGAEVGVVPRPLPQAHAHNDYEHARPLLDALDNGFCSVEADVHLVEGQLLVAHDRNQVSADRTLERLYLDPLRERAQKNGGRVYAGGPTVTLLIDIKSGADPTYTVLRGVLARYSDFLTSFDNGETTERAVTVVISGNRPRTLMAGETTRFAAVDGRIEDLGGGAGSGLIPLISNNWSDLFAWRGQGPLPVSERNQLDSIVRQAHREGRRVRFWNTPDLVVFWRELAGANVDLINADDLPGLRAFLHGAGK